MGVRSPDLVTAPAEWVRCIKRCQQARIRLVCLPHAGGAASSYYSWAKWLPDGIELLAIQYPGRQDRIGDPCVSRMDELAPKVAEALRQHLSGPTPLVLFGHSMGAWVAFEVARYLESYFARQPLGLIVSGQIAPHLPAEREWSTGSDEELIAQLHRIGSMDIESIERPELRELVMPAIRADFRLVKEYSPRPLRRVSVPIVSLRGADDSDVPSEKVDGWLHATRGAYRSRTLPGGHFYLAEHEDDFARELIRTLGWLAASDASTVPQVNPSVHDQTGHLSPSRVQEES
ncbi:thioesterase II family protein [Streptomyces sp. NPDC001858]